MRRYGIHFVCAAGFAVSLSADPPKRATTDFVPVEITSVGTWDSGAYAYDGAGNIKQIGTNVYQYDTAGRLVSGNVNGTGFRQDYNYDPFGNRILSTTTPSFACVGGIACEENVTIAPETNHITSNGAAYDAAGNLTALDGVTYTYSSLGMLQKQTNTGAQFLYTADGERIATIRSGSWTWTLRDQGGKVLRVFTSGDGASNFQWSKDYVYRNGLLLAAQTPSMIEHLHLDHLGTPRLVSDQNGAQIGAHSYFAFGAELNITPVESSLERIKFTGHERDVTGAVADLDYMHARYDGTALGRFLSVDPVISSATSPQSWNRYSYVANNPINRVDPTGKVLEFTTDSDDLMRMAEQVANSGMFGLELKIACNGTASLVSNGFSGPPTEAEAAAADNLQEVIDNAATTSIALTENSSVVMGSYNRGAIDLGDMAKLGTGPGPTMAGAINHEIREQFIKQVVGPPADPPGSPAGHGAHLLATQTESKVIGWSIGPQRPVSGPADFRRFFLDPSQVEAQYTRGTETLTVLLYWQNYNLMSRVP